MHGGGHHRNPAVRVRGYGGSQSLGKRHPPTLQKSGAAAGGGDPGDDAPFRGRDSS